MVKATRNKVMSPNINLPIEKVAELCNRWQATDLALFGSILRDDFWPSRDIDVLVTFAPKFRKGLPTLVHSQHILESAKVFYAA